VVVKSVLTYVSVGVSVGVSVFAGLVLAGGGAYAQDAPAAASRPDTKMVGDWMVRCFPLNNPNPCDVFQELDDKRTRQRVLSLSLAYMPSQDRHLLQITAPLEVSIPKGLTIQTDMFTSPVMQYRMCTREGCFVQTAPDNAMIAALAKSGPDARINVVGDNGKAYAIRFSLKGFSAAHDDMVAQAKVKAKPAGDAAKPAAKP
jgi:invasion protein IalB